LAARGGAAILARMQSWLNRHRTWIVLGTGGVVLALVVAVQLQQAPHPPRSGAAPSAGPTRTGALADALDAAAPSAAVARADLPPGVTEAQWLALRAELLARPGGEAELRRIGDYLAWSDALRRWRAAPGDANERLRLARQLDAGLPARLREGEVTSAEARQIKIALLDVTLDDPAERAAALQRWMAAQASPSSVDPRQVEFDRRQASVVAAWSARPPATRDAAGLERELDALRREVFGSAAPAAP
jgi:hypothetical protein